MVTFRMYQLNFDEKDHSVFRKYWDNSAVHFVDIIPASGGIFGAAVIWYLKAVQLENGIKIQLGMIKKLIDLGEENQAEEIKERTIQKMKDRTEALIDEALEATDIQNF